MVGRWLVKSTALVLVKLPRGQICALIHINVRERERESWKMMRGLESCGELENDEGFGGRI